MSFPLEQQPDSFSEAGDEDAGSDKGPGAAATVLAFLLEGLARLSRKACIIGASLTYFQAVEAVAGTTGVAARAAARILDATSVSGG